MLDGVSLDQLRTFVTAVDEGSFSAAGRRLNRAQSAISELVRSLEEQFGVQLFDRTGRYPQLTPAGTALLVSAREVVAGVDSMKVRARGMAAGLEPELTVVLDVFFPIEALTTVAKEFRELFPAVPLRLYVEALGAAYQPVLDRQASVGIVGFLPVTPPGIISEPLVSIGFAMVAAADHPLAALSSPIPHSELAKHVQLVLTDRSQLSKGRDFGVMSPHTWKLADLFAKRAFLLNGLGWGGMPIHAIQADLDSGRLVRLRIEDEPATGVNMMMSAVYRVDSPPGPAGRWLIARMMACSRHHLADT